jgi:hypothetical protein
MIHNNKDQTESNHRAARDYLENPEPVFETGPRQLERLNEEILFKIISWRSDRRRDLLECF